MLYATNATWDPWVYYCPTTISSKFEGFVSKLTRKPWDIQGFDDPILELVSKLSNYLNVGYGHYIAWDSFNNTFHEQWKILGTGLGRKGNFCLDKQFVPWTTVNQFAIWVKELASELCGFIDIVWVFHFDLLKNKKYMRRLSDREWVGHCTVDMLEELQRLATGGVFQSSPG